MGMEMEMVMVLTILAERTVLRNHSAMNAS